MTLPATMAGVQLIGHGGPDRLVWNDAIPLPVPGPGEVLVQVLAAGVNNTDINTRIGWYAPEVKTATDAGTEGVETGGWAGALRFPLVQGGDLCGRVVAHGPDVTAPAIGTRVICANCQAMPTADAPLAIEVIGSDYDGAFAEFCAVPARHLHDVDASPLTDVEIGAMPCAFGTAWNMLARGGAARGDDVLITGASGGVGLAAVALAQVLGANVTAQTAAHKADAVRAAGAHHIIDRAETPPKAAFDLCIDVVGGEGWGGLLDALRTGGRIVVSGAIAGPIVETDLRTLYLRDLTIHGATFQPADVFAGLVDLINTGAVRPLISRTYPLRDIGKAQADFASKRYPGKLVLIP
ncbi:MAG: zinc-binding dehydrogenase [Rhodobacteraceae bacterium]|nr:zinc-binding dehydrogenase [Paracoccaceae bacterium]